MRACESARRMAARTQAKAASKVQLDFRSTLRQHFDASDRARSCDSWLTNSEAAPQSMRWGCGALHTVQGQQILPRAITSITECYARQAVSQFAVAPQVKPPFRSLQNQKLACIRSGLLRLTRRLLKSYKMAQVWVSATTASKMTGSHHLIAKGFLNPSCSTMLR